MNREEFMKKLEYLLSDIPDDDKADAIEYYRDYLEEAGEENEDQVIKEFGSPERIASIIRSEIAGMEDGGTFTENGYEDARFKEPNYQMAKRYDLPETVENQPEDKKKPNHMKEKKKDNNRVVKIILLIILLIVASPILLGLGSGFVGFAVGMLGFLLAMVIAIGVITFVFLVVGFVLAIVGIISMPIRPLGGLLFLGTGILLFGFGLFGLAVSGLFYGKFLPYIFRSITNLISRLVHARRERS